MHCCCVWYISPGGRYAPLSASSDPPTIHPRRAPHAHAYARWRGAHAEAQLPMAELHIIGELVGGSDFPSADLFCKWSVSHGSGWRVLEGAREGQTQIDHPQVGGCTFLCIYIVRF